MRIGFFTDSYLANADGIGISIETFREQLELLGHEVYIIAPAVGFRHKETNKRVIRFPAVKGIFYDDQLTSFYFPPQALARIEKVKLDLVHYHTPGQVGLLGAFYAIRKKLPLVTTYHTDLYEYVTHYKNVLPGSIALSLLAPVITGGGLAEYRSSLSSIRPERNIDKWNQKIVERGITMVHNACDEVIAPSRKMQKQLQSWKATSPISILPTGVNHLQTTATEVAKWRTKLELNDDTPVILYVGRIGTEKNIGLLLKTFDQIAKRHSTVRLVIVGGSGSLTKEADSTMIEEAKQTAAGKRIVFTGFVPHADLGALYGLATVFAFPSIADTQALVVNEAASAGLPIVMVDREISEVMKDRQNGLYAKPTPRDFANKLLQVINDPELQKRYGARSLELAVEFTASNQAAKLLRLYENVIERHYASVSKPKRRLPWKHE